MPCIGGHQSGIYQKTPRKGSKWWLDLWTVTGEILLRPVRATNFVVVDLNIFGEFQLLCCPVGEFQLVS